MENTKANFRLRVPELLEPRIAPATLFKVGPVEIRGQIVAPDQGYIYLYAPPVGTTAVHVFAINGFDVLFTGTSYLGGHEHFFKIEWGWNPAKGFHNSSDFH